MFAECPINGTRQSWLCRNCLWRVLFAECYTRRTICRVFSVFCRVFRALGKLKESGSDEILLEMSFSFFSKKTWMVKRYGILLERCSMVISACCLPLKLQYSLRGCVGGKCVAFRQLPCPYACLPASNSAVSCTTSRSVVVQWKQHIIGYESTNGYPVACIILYLRIFLYQINVLSFFFDQTGGEASPTLNVLSGMDVQRSCLILLAVIFFHSYDFYSTWICYDDNISFVAQHLQLRGIGDECIFVARAL